MRLRHGGRDIDKIIVTAGGSATNDAGVVMAQALSVKMFSASGDLLSDGLGGGELAELDDITMLVACDVVNPLTGKFGASAVYGRQKGASSADFAKLETNLRSVAALIRRDLEVSVAKLERGGAGGGIAAGLVAFASAKLVPGIELVANFARFERHLPEADLVITGEGRIDVQTAYGKAPGGVAAAVAKYGVPVVALGGALWRDARKVLLSDFDAIESAIVRDCSLDETLNDAASNVSDAGERIARWITLGEKITSRR